MGHHHHLQSSDGYRPPNGFLLANARTEGTFEEIPVM